jgi:hypothetical protein
MEKVLLGLIAFAFFLFILGLAGKSRAIHKKSLEKSEIYQRVTVFAIILMLLSAFIYSIIALN